MGLKKKGLLEQVVVIKGGGHLRINIQRVPKTYYTAH